MRRHRRPGQAASRDTCPAGLYLFILLLCLPTCLTQRPCQPERDRLPRHPLRARPTWSCAAPQVGRAFEYLRRAEDADRPDVRYEVGVRRAGGAARARGVYLREPLDALRPVSVTADVRPRLHEAGAPLI